jgi:hypothetical protein
MAQAQDLARDTPFLGKPQSYRLSATQGGVAPLNAIVPASTNAKVRFRVRGASQVIARVRATIVGTVTMQLYPMLADALQDDTKGTRSGFRDDGTAVPAAVALANNTENVVRLALAGVDYVELEIAVAAASTFDPTSAGNFVDIAVN